MRKKFKKSLANFFPEIQIKHLDQDVMFHLFNQVKRFKVNIICSIKTVMGGPVIL